MNIAKNVCGVYPSRAAVESASSSPASEAESFFQRVASRTDRAVEPHRPGRQIESSEIGDRPPGSQRVGQSAVVAAGRDQHDGVARDGLAEV